MFALRSLRTLLIEGRRLATGVVFHADACAAAELVRSGTAVLLSDADIPRLHRALIDLKRAPQSTNGWSRPVHTR
jgi:hypothetical protein